MNINKIKIKHKLAIVSIAIIFSSCSSNLPSAEFAKDELNKNAKSPYELTEFQKTNGIEGKVDGKETYEMNFHAKLIARDSIYNFAKSGSDTMHVLKSNTARLKSFLFRSPYQSIYWEKVSSYGKGDMVKEIDGTVRFVKTENGWVINK